MKEKKSKLISILCTEIQDLSEDIGQLISMYGARRDNGEITNYVFLENSAVLNSEISCLKNFAQLVTGMNLDAFGTLEDLCSYISKEFRTQRRGCGYTPAIEDVFERKLQKVLTYVKS